MSQPPGSYLGFDFGTRKIGIAAGNTETGTATALATLRHVNNKPDWDAITRLIGEWQPAGLIVGLCYQEDGSENQVTRPLLKFCRQLEGRYQLPVYRHDETLSTFEAKQLLFDEAGLSAARLWEVQDQLAAQLILQSWLNQPAD